MIGIFSTANQDPEQAYIICLGKGVAGMPRVIPLIEGEYYIGRSRREHEFVNFLASSRPRTYPLWLPAPPGPSTIVPVGRIKVDSEAVYVMAGWHGQDAREHIEILTHQMPQELHTRLALKGFETLDFKGQPNMKLWYVPRMPPLDLSVSDKTLSRLEKHTLWASAAVGWEERHNYEQALLCWQQALQVFQRGAHPRLEQVNVLLSLARVIRYLGQDIETARKYQSLAAQLLDLPQIAYISSGNVGCQEQPLHLTLFVELTSRHASARHLDLRYRCERLGIYQRFLINHLSTEWSQSFSIQGIQKAGTYPVNVTLRIPGPLGMQIEYCFHDFIQIEKRRPQIHTGGDVGTLVIDGDPEDIPDIHIARDVGLIRLRIRTTDHDKNGEQR